MRDNARMPHRYLMLMPLLAAFASPSLAADALPAEVVVTATRRAAPRLEVPVSVTRLGADEIGLVGASHAAEALNRVAGVMIQRGSGQESLTAIRSPVLAGPGACGTFLLLEDGVPIRPVGSCNVNELFEIDTARRSPSRWYEGRE